MGKANNTKSSGRRQKAGARKKGDLLSYRAFLLLLGLVVIISVVALVLVKKRSAVDVSLKVGQMKFVVSDERADRLFNSVAANFITLSAFENLTVAEGRLETTSETDAQTGKPINWRRVERAAGKTTIVSGDRLSNITLEAVTLNHVVLTAGTNATLSWSPEEVNSIKLSLDKAATGEIAGGETLLFSCNGCHVRDFPAGDNQQSLYFRLLGEGKGGHVLHFNGRNDSTIIALDLAPGTKIKDQTIRIKGAVDFRRREADRLISTVSEGKIKFEDVDKEFAVTEGMFVILDDFQQAVIRTIEIDKGINVNLHGQSDKLSAGPEGDIKVRTPSVLEWLYARQPWVIVVQVITAILTVALGLLEKLKIFPRKT